MTNGVDPDQTAPDSALETTKWCHFVVPGTNMKPMAMSVFDKNSWANGLSLRPDYVNQICCENAYLSSHFDWRLISRRRRENNKLQALDNGKINCIVMRDNI